METVKFEIPRVPELLRAAAEWLLQEAGDPAQIELPLNAPAEVPISPTAATEEMAKALTMPNPFTVPAEGQTDVQPTIAACPQHGTVDLDAAGISWDSRIHASSKKFVKDGTWRLKRGTDPALVASVTAELKAVLGAPVFATPDAGVTNGGDLQDAPPPPPPSPAGITTLPDLMQKIISTEGMETAQVQAVLAELGVPSLPVLGNTRPDLIPAVAAKLFGS